MILTLRISAVVEQLRLLRDLLKRIANTSDIEPTILNPLLVAIDEAATNVVLHGYAGRKGYIEMEVETLGRDLTIRLRDKAPLHDPTTAPPPDLTLPIEQRPIGGLGVYIMQQVMDEVIYRVTEHNENELTLRKRLALRSRETKQMQIRRSSESGVHIVTLFGEFDAASAPAVEAQFASLFTGENQALVLDMAGVPFISSAGLRVLQQARRTSRTNFGRVVLVGVTEGVQFVLEQTGLATQFTQFPTVQAALDELGGNAPADVRVVEAFGEIDTQTAPELDAKLRAELAEGHYHLILDMTGVNYIASAGLRVLQATLMATRSHEGDLRLVGMQAEVRQVFDMLGFTPLFHLFDTQSEAVQSYMA